MAEAEDLKSSQCGFDPHSGHQNSAVHSLSIIIPGALLLLATFIKPTQKFLEIKNVKVVAGIAVVALVAYSFIN